MSAFHHFRTQKMMTEMFLMSSSTSSSLDTQVFSMLTIFKIYYPSMVKNVKVASLPVEYCAIMVAIMITRHCSCGDKLNGQQSPQKIAEDLVSLEFGQKGNFYVTAVALHHGIFIFKRILESMGYEIIEMHGKEKQLVDFFTLSGGKRGYDVKFPSLDAALLPQIYNEDTLNSTILVNRDLLLMRGNYTKSNYLSCSSLFLDLFVDIDAVVNEKEKLPETFLSPPTENILSTFKARKKIDELSDRSIKNNGKRILQYVESLFGEEDAELYLSAAYELVVKKKRKNNTPELRTIPYFEKQIEPKTYDEEKFENDMRVVNALNKIKKKYVVMSAEEKFQILTVFDAVKNVLSELDITEVDQESAEATLKLIQSYNGICNISERSIIRLNDNRDVVLKQRGKKIEKDFESEVWGNLMLCYYETNINLVSGII